MRSKPLVCLLKIKEIFGFQSLINQVLNLNSFCGESWYMLCHEPFFYTKIKILLFNTTKKLIATF